MVIQDVRVVAGNCECHVTHLQYNSLRARLCEDMRTHLSHSLTVYIGSLVFPIGHVRLGPVSENSHLKILIPLLSALASLLVLVAILAAFYACKKKKVVQQVTTADTSVVSAQHKEGVDTVDSHTLPPLPVDSVFGPERVTG